MSEYGVVTEPGTVRLERLLPGPVERVWSYLTESDRRAKWLAGGEIDQRPGGSVELRFRHADLSPVHEPTPERFKAIEGGHVIHGLVTACEPPTRLSITWEMARGPESEVTFELEPRGDRVLLVVTHRRLLDRSAMLSVASGWHTHLAILTERLGEREPPPFWSTLAGIEREYQARLPGA
jgi:uncharacterized protein YndB with AHSA1/START domain